MNSRDKITHCPYSSRKRYRGSLYSTSISGGWLLPLSWLDGREPDLAARLSRRASAHPVGARRSGTKNSGAIRRVALPVTVTAGMIRVVTERRRGSYKGPRELVGTRVHVGKKDEIDRAVADAGAANRNDWIAAAIELALNNPQQLRSELRRLRAERPQLAFDNNQEILGESA